MEPSLILAYALIVLGLFFLAAELFMPSGTFLVLSLAAIVIGVSMTFIYSEDPTRGIVTLICVFAAVPLVGGVVLHYWPKTRIGKRFFLKGPEEDATMANMPVNLDLEQLRGRFGRTVSPLRPAGVTNFDGRRVDTITEGMMVDEGHWVRCIDVRAGKVIVRQVDKPDLGDLENALFE